MVIFHRCEIRLKPGETMLDLFVPDSGELDQHPEIQELLAREQPRSFQIVDHPCWYENGEPNRNATLEEIAVWTKEDAYLHMPGMTVLPPTHYYRYFGNPEVLDTLHPKLQAEYEAYRGQWNAAFSQGKDAFYEKLPEICVVQTVYRNLEQCSASYDQGYLAALAEEETPLATLAQAYDQGGYFEIGPNASLLLEDVELNRENLAEYYKLDDAAAGMTDHAALMELLDAHLDQEYALMEQQWSSMDFEGALDHAVEMYTFWQFYQTFRFEKDQYPASSLDLMAQLKEPMQENQGWMIGERVLYEMSLDEISQLLPRLYPDVVPEEDPWGMFGNRELFTRRDVSSASETGSVPSFRIRDGMKKNYLELRAERGIDGIVRYAERWSQMMEQEIKDGASVAEAAERTNHSADTDGITGYMYGQAVRLLSNYWEHGEELRQWHNQRLGYSGEGVINPAILAPPAKEDALPDMEPEEPGPAMSQ